MRKIPLDIGTLHFVGIGGIGMSGIAEILLSLGYSVQGSDQSQNANVSRLQKKSVVVHHGHIADHITDDIAAVIISSAIKQDNPELVAAREKNIPIVRRADMLAELMRLKWAVSVGGTHGKTTTTSLVGAVLEEGALDPTVINGGIIHSYGTNTRLGQGEWMVVESDESDGTFTRLPSTVAIVTNIDPEHMDHYGSFEDVKLAYRQFVDNIPFYGFAVLCSDHPEVQSLIPHIQDRRFVSYGFNPQADVRAVNVRYGQDGNTFDVQIGETLISDIYLPMLGDHNIQNALAAIAVAHELEVSDVAIKKALRHFQGVHRRFTKTGVVNGITVIDDYGHHPIEIKAVLKASRQSLEGTGGKVIAVMQPHRYSRLCELMDEFCTSFNQADSVYISNVYEAGEQPIEGATKEALVEGIASCGHKDVHCFDQPSELPSIIAEKASAGDIVIFLGAGDITQWATSLPDELKIILNKGAQSA
jgi:UDP-N-acetylmuramate--alanine ligase